MLQCKASFFYRNADLTDGRRYNRFYAPDNIFNTKAPSAFKEKLKEKILPGNFF